MVEPTLPAEPTPPTPAQQPPVVPPVAPPVKPDGPPNPQDKAATDAYAQALLHQVNLDYAEHEKALPQTKHIFNKKRLMWLVVSTVLSLIIGVVAAHLFKSKNSGSSSGGQSETQQVIQGATNFNNPKAY